MGETKGKVPTDANTVAKNLALEADWLEFETDQLCDLEQVT